MHEPSAIEVARGTSKAAWRNVKSSMSAVYRNAHGCVNDPFCAPWSLSIFKARTGEINEKTWTERKPSSHDSAGAEIFNESFNWQDEDAILGLAPLGFETDKHSLANLPVVEGLDLGARSRP